MAGKYQVEGAEGAERVHDLFAAVASRYDLINDLQSFGLHRLWKGKLVRLAELKPGERVLDVCCGTGDVAFALAQKGADVTGIDFSEPMLTVARKRLKERSRLAARLRFQHGDALHLPFADGTFAVVTISYGLRNLADFEGGLRELLRVLQPGGRLLVLDFGKPEFAPWRILYFQYLRWLVPWFGRIFCGDADAYGYILDSLRRYPGQRGVDSSLRALGCQTRVINLIGGAMGINWARRQG